MHRLWHREDGDQRMTSPWGRKLRQIERGGLRQVGQRFFDRFALRRRSGFRIQGNEAALFGRRKDSCQFHGYAFARDRSIVAQSTQ